MSLIAWNCQGFGAPLAVSHLREEVRKARPQLVFLMETKQQEKFLERKRRSMEFEESWYVSPMGKSGGLALWWKEDLTVNILSSSKNVIHTKLECVTASMPSYVSFIYGPPVEEDEGASRGELGR